MNTSARDRQHAPVDHSITTQLFWFDLGKAAGIATLNRTACQIYVDAIQLPEHRLREALNQCGACYYPQLTDPFHGNQFWLSVIRPRFQPFQPLSAREAALQRINQRQQQANRFTNITVDDLLREIRRHAA